MRQSTRQYAAVFAKCRAKFATFLKDSDYSTLAEMKDVSGIASYLMQGSDYAEDLIDVDIRNIHRAELEGILYGNLMRSYKSLYVFTNGTLRAFIGAIQQKFNIEMLLKIALNIHNPSSLTNDGTGIVLSSIKSDIDMVKLSSAQTLEQFGEAMTGTRYYNSFQKSYSGGILDYASFEVGLYNEYYNYIYRQYVDKRRGAASKSIGNLMHLMVDLTNISTILRMKFSFEAKADKIIPMLLTIKGGRDRREYIMLCNMSKAEFIEFLQNSKYNRLAAVDENISTAEYMANFLNIYYRRLMNNPEPSFEHPFAYLSLKEQEIMNLVHVIEGIRYGISPENIIKKIITLNI